MKILVFFNVIFRYTLRNSRGSIFILALWSVYLLSAYAVILNYTVRQKLTLVDRLEEREQLYLAAEAGIKKAALLVSGMHEKAFFALKQDWSSNSAYFKDIAVGAVKCDIGYSLGETQEDGTFRWGLIDESGKININTADLAQLRRLFQFVLKVDENTALDLAACIIDFRDKDDTSEVPAGGAENTYYKGLRFSYEAKNAPFEVLDELLFVKGITPDFFMKLRDFVTVYGNGMVNINTASKQVLVALGLSENTAAKIITFRAAQDAIEATADDNVFDSSDIVQKLKMGVNLSGEEILLLQEVTNTKFSIASQYFTAMARVRFKNRKYTSSFTAVIDLSGKIVYWQGQS